LITGRWPGQPPKRPQHGSDRGVNPSGGPCTVTVQIID
jgi:hypothetical protein